MSLNKTTRKFNVYLPPKGGRTCSGDPISASDSGQIGSVCDSMELAALLEAVVSYLSSTPTNCQPFAMKSEK